MEAAVLALGGSMRRLQHRVRASIAQCARRPVLVLGFFGPWREVDAGDGGAVLALGPGLGP